MILEVQDLTKVFRRGSAISTFKVRAVDQVSFHVDSREIFGLAGESGCGKTTIARMILGFQEPTSGKIIYHSMNGRSPSRKNIWRAAKLQAIFQNPYEAFNPLRMVESYLLETAINFGLAHSRAEAQAKVEQDLDAVGLNYREISGRYPGELSGGQLQRLAIGKALLIRPSLLIADEPVSMVDASLRMSICNLLKEIKESHGVSIINVTHDLTTAYYVCDRIAIMFRGNLVEMGDVEKVLIEPKHPYTKLLRESIPEADPTKRWTTKLQLTETEEEEYLRVGCKFSGRCTEVMDICKNQVPQDVEVNDVLVKCFLYS